MNSIYDYSAFISASIAILLILIQTRGASLGAGLGGAGTESVSVVRRGADKTLHNLTIGSVFIFGFSLIAGFLV